MNRYFEDKQDFNSNSRIFNAYYANQKNTDHTARNEIDTLCEALSKARKFKLFKVALRVAKPVVFSVALIGTVGVAGAIEAGSLGLGTGIALSLALLGIEYLCLRRQRA